MKISRSSSLDCETVAVTDRPRLLFETGLPTRYYIPEVDVRTDLLTANDTSSVCPYKGTARYWSLSVGDRTIPDAVWSFADPVPQTPTIKGLLSFFDERIEKGLIAKLSGIVNTEFVRMDYGEAIKVLERAKEKFEFPMRWGVDLQSEHERYLTEKHVKRPVIVMNYPKDIKAFYMRVNDDGRTVAALDVLAHERSEGMDQHPLVAYARRHQHILVTPHIGGCTVESMARTELFLAEKLRSAMTQPGFMSGGAGSSSRPSSGSSAA